MYRNILEIWEKKENVNIVRDWKTKKKNRMNRNGTMGTKGLLETNFVFYVGKDKDEGVTWLVVSKQKLWLPYWVDCRVARKFESYPLRACKTFSPAPPPSQPTHCTQSSNHKTYLTAEKPKVLPYVFSRQILSDFDSICALEVLFIVWSFSL